MKRTLVQNKILRLMVPLVTITLVVMMLASYQTSFTTQKTFFEFCMEELAAKSAKEVTTKIKTQKVELEWMATDPAFQNMDADEYADRLSFYAEDEKDLFAMIFVAYPDGRYYIANKGFADANVSDRKYFQEIFGGHKDFAMSSPDVSKSTGIKKYTLATPIKNGGQTVGILCVNVSLDFLKQVVADCKFGHNGITYVVDETSLLIGTLYDDLALQFNLVRDGGAVYPGLEVISEAVTRGVAMKGYATEAQSGTVYYTMSQKIEDTPGWFVLGCIPDD